MGVIRGVGGVAFDRTWALLLGVSGLIILFWFLKGGEVLRYLVSAAVPPFSSNLAVFTPPCT